VRFDAVAGVRFDQLVAWMVAKYADHVPVHRQSAIYASRGDDLEPTLLASWVDAASALLRPLGEALRHHVFATAEPAIACAPGVTDRAAIRRRLVRTHMASLPTQSPDRQHGSGTQ
jgi:hypothetical protein